MHPLVANNCGNVEAKAAHCPAEITGPDKRQHVAAESYPGLLATTDLRLTASRHGIPTSSHRDSVDIAQVGHGLVRPLHVAGGKCLAPPVEPLGRGIDGSNLVRGSSMDPNVFLLLSAIGTVHRHPRLNAIPWTSAQPKRIAEVDRIAVGKPIEVQPTGKAGGIFLGERPRLGVIQAVPFVLQPSLTASSSA